MQVQQGKENECGTQTELGLNSIPEHSVCPRQVSHLEDSELWCPHKGKRGCNSQSMTDMGSKDSKFKTSSTQSLIYRAVY